MKYYKCNLKFDSLIDIFDIFLGPEMHEALNYYGTIMHGPEWDYPYTLIYDTNLFPLNRIPVNEKSFIKDLSIPPVKLKKIGNRYEIIDGRHRVVLSILYGYTHVPAILTY